MENEQKKQIISNMDRELNQKSSALGKKTNYGWLSYDIMCDQFWRLET